MNWHKLSSFLQWLMYSPSCILVFLPCASATIGLLYLQRQIDVGFQYMPAIASLGFFIPRLLYMIEHGIHLTRNELLAYGFAISTAVSVGIQLHLGLDALDRDGLSSLDYTVAMWAFNMFYFFAGAACNRASYRKSNIVAVVLTLLVLVPWLYAPKNGIFFDYWLLRQASGIDKFNHLLIAEWCVFLFIGAFAFAGSTLRPVIIVVAVICLFGMQGRSSTLFTLFTLVFFWFLMGGKKIIILYAGLASVLIGVFFFTPAGDFIVESNDKSLDRMLLSEGDESLQGRSNIFIVSLEHLPSSIPYGDPTYIAHEAGSMGSYIHNILSMWQFFGLLPFVLILALLVFSLLAMRARIKQGDLSVMEEFACMLIIYASVSVVLSKSVVFYWLWFAVGYWMLKYADKKHLLKVKTIKPSKTAKKKRRSKKTYPGGVPSGKLRW